MAGYAIVIPYGFFLPTNCHLTLPNNVRVLEDAVDPQGDDQLLDRFISAVRTDKWSEYYTFYGEYAQKQIGPDLIVLVRNCAIAHAMGRRILCCMMPTSQVNRKVIKASAPLGVSELISESGITEYSTYSNCVEAIRTVRSVIIGL
jgi:hypothetical protein